MKKCARCQETKPAEEFRTHRAYCVECNRAYGRENYRKNKDRYFRQAQKRDHEMDTFLAEAKSVPCTDCGVSYPHYVMDFDHLSDKEFGIAQMRRRRMAFSRIRAEIAKCEVVCSNCHRERTNQRNPSRYTRRLTDPEFDQ